MLLLCTIITLFPCTEFGARKPADVMVLQLTSAIVETINLGRPRVNEAEDDNI